MTTITRATVGSSISDPHKTREELLRKARDLVPVLRARAVESNQNYRVSPETVQDLEDAGLMRAATPARWGGYEGVDFDLTLEIAAELARGDMSVAWCYSFWLSHNWLAGGISEKAQAEYFADGPNQRSSTTSAAVWDETRFGDDGYTLSGHWKFSSGSDYSNWFFVQASDLPAALLLVPRANIEVDNNWRTLGLRGSGSNDVHTLNTHVPAHRIWTPLDSAIPGGAPGWRNYGLASHRILMWMFIYSAISPIVGAAEGALEVFHERYDAFGAPVRKGPTSSRVPESSLMQVVYAEASAEVENAQRIWRTDMAAAMEQARAGVPWDTLSRARLRRNQVYAVKLAVRAVTRMYEASGAHSVLDTDPLQRFFRDVQTGSHHFSVEWDSAMTTYGESAFHLPFKFDHHRDGIEPSLVEIG